jgi:glutaconate CoA-transferase, subunit A
MPRWPMPMQPGHPDCRWRCSVDMLVWIAIVHAQCADRAGNVLIEGIIGVQKEAVLAAKCAIVTVESVVDELDAHPNACVLPSWTIDAIAVVPGGARPSYVHGRYGRDNDFYQRWDAIARDRESFRTWMDVNVLGAQVAERVVA